MQHLTQITISTEHGELEDVPALFGYDTIRVRRDPSVGDFTGYTEIDTCELARVSIGCKTLFRSELVDMVGPDEVLRIEKCVAEALRENIANRGLAT